MRIGPVQFASPWLLLGLLAAAIPPVLHLLSARRAREAPFPTLRLLQRSAQRTSRRRHIRHWLLLLLRSCLLALLAVACARLILHASGARFGDDYAAVLIVDNSASMAAGGPSTRLDRAKEAAAELLCGADAPGFAAWMATCDDAPPNAAFAAADELAESVAAIEATNGRADLAACIDRAAEMLGRRGESGKRIYVFTDMQRSSFSAIASPLRSGADNRVLVVDVSGGRPANVGVVSLAIDGRPVVDQGLEVAARLRNSGDDDATVTVRLHVDGASGAEPRTVTVGGGDVEPVVVRFRYAFTRPGDHAARVAIGEPDDLAADNQRELTLTLTERARALVIGGPPHAGAHDDGAKVLQFALDPRTNAATPWSIRSRMVRATAFRPRDLDGVDAVFCADVRSFRPSQRDGLVDFVRRGGRLLLFTGDQVDADTWNRQLGEILPARLIGPVGQIGPDAPAAALGEVLTDHTWLRGLDLTAAERRQVLTQRYFRVEAPAAAESAHVEVLLRLTNGDPLVLSRPVGRGRVVLCTTTASLQWTNLPSVGLSVFVPMLERICLDGLSSGEAPSASSDNVDQAELDLRPIEAGELVESIGPDRTFVGPSIADVHAAASGRAAGLNLSEPLLILVVAGLVLETRLANRRRRAVDAL